VLAGHGVDVAPAAAPASVRAHAPSSHAHGGAGLPSPADMAGGPGGAISGQGQSPVCVPVVAWVGAGPIDVVFGAVSGGVAPLRQALAACRGCTGQSVLHLVQGPRYSTSPGSPTTDPGREHQQDIAAPRDLGCCAERGSFKHLYGALVLVPISGMQRREPAADPCSTHRHTSPTSAKGFAQPIIWTHPAAPPPPGQPKSSATCAFSRRPSRGQIQDSSTARCDSGFLELTENLLPQIVRQEALRWPTTTPPSRGGAADQRALVCGSRLCGTEHRCTTIPHKPKQQAGSECQFRVVRLQGLPRVNSPGGVPLLTGLR
jgi:hypothetical protein